MDFSKEMLNIALDMSLEFGENWLKPIHKRLHKKYPEMFSENLERINSLCKEVNKVANDYVYKSGSVVNKEISFVDFEKFKDYILLKYNWISECNLSRLYSQSCYYAMK